MPVNTRTVMSQTKGRAGLESCGYHAFKNVLLSLAFDAGMIDESKLNLLLQDESLFCDIFEKTVTEHHDGSKDVVIPRFIELLEYAARGMLDFEQLPAETQLIVNAAHRFGGKISVAQCLTGINMPGYGLTGQESDLIVAANIAKLNRAKTIAPVNHVFALGIMGTSSIGHWVCVRLSQDINGVRQWEFMDSWSNQNSYHYLVDKLERLLDKDEAQLNDYLINAYTNVNDVNFDVIFNNHFVQIDGDFMVLEEDAEHYFFDNLRNLDDVTDYINNRYQFMSHVNWLDKPGEQEKQLIKKLHCITQYILTTCNKLETSPRKSMKDELGAIKPEIAQRLLHTKAVLRDVEVKLSVALAPKEVVVVQSVQVTDDMPAVVSEVDEKAPSQETTEKPIVQESVAKITTPNNVKKDTTATNAARPQPKPHKSSSHKSSVQPPNPLEKPVLNRPTKETQQTLDKKIAKKGSQEYAHMQPRVNITPDKPRVDEALQQQVQYTLSSLNKDPKPTATFWPRFVNSIKSIFEQFKNFVFDVARKIGIVS
jgi:hypothetical protein